MKKLLLAAAVAAAMPVLAQAQTNVTMYGIADAGVGALKSNIPGTSTSMRVDSGIQSTSRWGVRGSEDLGGGLSAIFNAEAAWNVDDGTGGATTTQTTAATPSAPTNSLNFQRRSFVGLQGGFGQIYLGRDYTPAFYGAITGDLFGYGMNGSTLVWNTAGFVSIRYSNAIFYNTPTWGGLQIRTVYGKATGQGTEYADASKKRDTNFEIAALYAAGAITGSLYYRQGYLNTFGPVGTPAVTTSPVTAPLVSPAKVRQYGVNAGYNFGPARVVAGYSASDPDNFGLITDKVQMYNVGVGVRAGAGEVMLQVHEVRYTAVAGGAKPKADTIGLAYTYPLSKRTNLYATYAYTRNKNGAALGIQNSSNTYATAANQNPQAVAFGIRHQF